jgi:hypothetical protein
MAIRTKEAPMQRPLACVVCRQYFDAQHSSDSQCPRCQDLCRKYPGLIELISDMIAAAIAEHDQNRAHQLRP